MGAEQADRTLFVGNLHPRATEELLFELFLQAGPTVNVKIPKDKDGKPKLFAFVNFKHEESVPYGMNLLNGIKLFGRPLKLQYRSGSTHLSQDTNLAQSPQGNAPGNSQASNGNSYPRQDVNEDFMKYTDFSPGASYQRPHSSPDNLQRQAMMNNFYKQEPSWYSPNSNHPTQHRYDSPPEHRNSRNHVPHPYENYNNRDMYNRGGQEESQYRSHGVEEHHYRSHGPEEQHYRSRGQERSSPYSRKDPRWGPPHH
ncbi:unnamed protein product [Staurois parvus]|uniref:RRM domain-containing protein n=1 Tax=Staurois parvus TaxID=386267 RepID=A0ABN9EJY9_9NEOB|nr:unnamed protein product [Staurois parvus]